MPHSSPAYLTMLNGPSPGVHFALDDGAENRIGRGLDCRVVLNDRRCSRVHAVVVRADGCWWLRDAGSRNGTYVNGQKVDEAQLVEGSTLRIGSAEFSFHLAAQSETNVTQTIVRDTPVSPHDTGSLVRATLQDAGRTQDFVLLHELSVQMIGCSDPDEVVRDSLEVLHQRMKASLVGFLWVNDDGQLKPKLVVPQELAGQAHLSAALTEHVCKKRRAIWVDTQTGEKQLDNLEHFADAICVPLLQDETTLGAIHVYLEHGRFDQNEFDFALSVANMLGIALVRTRRQALLQADHRRLVAKSGGFDELVGDSKPMLDLKGKITRIGRAAGCVLIRGESGSGKELVARAIHKASSRADRPMLTVNCAAIPRDLMESQLFGHKKGAFTGADADHVGWFQQADSGTLFLDEVGELTLEGQAKLLRILEGHPFLPVGSTKEVRADVRLIAATNRDLGEFVRDGRFREDLYYRLCVFELHLPPLRDRGEDILRLVQFFLDQFKIQHGRQHLGLSPAAREKLLAYHWPGNVRQLRNVIDSAVVMADGDEIQPHDLGLRDVGGQQLDTLNLEHWERKLIAEALTRSQNNVAEAAKLLGLGRATLYQKIKEYGLQR